MKQEVFVYLLNLSLPFLRIMCKAHKFLVQILGISSEISKWKKIALDNHLRNFKN